MVFARRLGQTSRFGAFLDPVADKLMVAAVLILIVEADPRPLIAIPAIVIIGREIAVSGLREFMAEIGQRATVAVATIGKIKTAAQMLALLLMLYRDDVGAFPTYFVGFLLFYVSAALTLWSMLVYLRGAWPIMRPQVASTADEDSLDSSSGDNKIRDSVARE